jgi:hypothetical protein
MAPLCSRFVVREKETSRLPDSNREVQLSDFHTRIVQAA